MNKQTTTTIMTHLRWGAFFLVLLFLGFQVIPRAIGQRDASKKSSDVEIPLLKQQPPPLEPAVCLSWAATGSLNTGRYFHTATLLPNGMMLVAGDLALAALPRARNCTIRRAGPGLPQAASTPHAMCTRRPCCPTAWCWLQGDVVAVSVLPRARNCTTRRAGPGRPQAASTPRALITQRPCCPTAWCWLQGDLIDNVNTSASAELYDPAQRDLECHGQPQHRTLDVTRRPCYPTAWCWLPVAVQVPLAR